MRFAMLWTRVLSSKEVHMGSSHLLEVTDLKVSFFTHAGEVKAVDGISYFVDEGEVLGIVGESGSGKSVEAYSVMGLLQNPGRIVDGKILFEGRDVISMSRRERRSLCGKDISMISQNPMTCLNPVYTIGTQLCEALRNHEKVTKKEALKRVKEALKKVGINNIDQRVNQYPHELSGGMRQRVMIAMGMICNPKLLIADEPTTALDVTIQAQILELMRGLQKETGMGVIFITHNLGVVAEICDKVAVMYAGRLVEKAPVRELFYRPAHPYTAGLLQSMPNMHSETHERLLSIPGTPVNLLEAPSGCMFHPRCKHCMEICRLKTPEEIRIGEKHFASCWRLCTENLTEEEKHPVSQCPGKEVP